MKKKIIFIISIILIVLIIGSLVLYINREYPDNEDTLYSIKFDDYKLRIQRYDYALGQNQLVAVEKTTNKGKTYEKISDELITVSMEPKFIFLNKKIGFAISKPNLTKENDYLGFKVTQDGGKTFKDAKIHFNNSHVSIITFDDVPYYDKDVLHIKGSVYMPKNEELGYENVELTLISLDNGINWYLEDNYYDNMPVIERLDNIRNLLKDELIDMNYIDKNNINSFKVTKMYINGYYKNDKNRLYCQVTYIYKNENETKSRENNIWITTDENEVFEILDKFALHKSDVDSGNFVFVKEWIH